MSTVTSGPPRRSSRIDPLYRLYDATGALPILFVPLIVCLSLFVPHFLAVHNIQNILHSSSFLIIVAAGQMLVLIVGGFDLSVGAVVALASVVSAMVMVELKPSMPAQPGFIIFFGVLAGLGCGLVVGLVNGLCVALLQISPFMVTLGTMSVATGVAFLLTNGIPVYGMPVSYVQGFGRALWLRLPTAVYLAFAIVAAIWVMQNFTRTGRYILAIGGNLQAACFGRADTNASGACLTFCSLLAAVTGLGLTAQIGSGQAFMGAQLTLESIAAAVIAGVSIKGGVGRVEMVALGSIFLLVITDAMDLLNVDTRLQTIFLGVILIFAVALDELGRRRRAHVQR